MAKYNIPSDSEQSWKLGYKRVTDSFEIDKYRHARSNVEILNQHSFTLLLMTLNGASRNHNAFYRGMKAAIEEYAVLLTTSTSSTTVTLPKKPRALRQLKASRGNKDSKKGEGESDG